MLSILNNTKVKTKEQIHYQNYLCITCCKKPCNHHNVLDLITDGT